MKRKADVITFVDSDDEDEDIVVKYDQEEIGASIPITDEDRRVFGIVKPGISDAEIQTQFDKGYNRYMFLAASMIENISKEDAAKLKTQFEDNIRSKRGTLLKYDSKKHQAYYDEDLKLAKQALNAGISEYDKQAIQTERVRIQNRLDNQNLALAIQVYKDKVKEYDTLLAKKGLSDADKKWLESEEGKVDRSGKADYLRLLEKGSVDADSKKALERKRDEATQVLTELKKAQPNDVNESDVDVVCR